MNNLNHKPNLPLLNAAFQYAEAAHFGQVRKYTGEPYVAHPITVANILLAAGIHDPNMLAAALLHDVVEDTDRTLLDIRRIFGPDIAQLVGELTDVSMPEHGNRAVRKRIDREHTKAASPRAKTIKLADLIDNTRSIVKHDPDFARVYLVEKLALLDVLIEGDPELWLTADLMCRAGLVQVGKEDAITAHDGRLSGKSVVALIVDEHFA